MCGRLTGNHRSTIKSDKDVKMWKCNSARFRMQLGFCDAVRLTRVVLVLVCLGVSFRLASGYSTGAPASACTTMMPYHGGNTPQKSVPPYKVSVFVDTYQPGYNYTVVMEGSPYIVGFLLEARTRSNNTPVGTFLREYHLNANVTCGGSGFTHATSRSRRYKVVVTWVAPTSPGLGDIFFVATFVQNYATFWTNVASRFIAERSSKATNQNATNTKLTEGQVSSFSDVSTDDCDKTMGCHREPADCVTGTCDFLLTWQDAGPAAVNFQMSASVPAATHWIGAGLSLDADMGADSVISCVYSESSGSVFVEHSWNVGKRNIIFRNPHIGLVNGTISGEFYNYRIVCRFQRQKVVNVTTIEPLGTVYPIDVPDTHYHILLVKGPARGGVKQKHTWRSEFEISFTDYVTVSSDDESLERNLIKAHGILMMFAWMVFAGFGMLLPRYYKPAWPTALCCGKKAWFQLHQGVMASTLIITAAGFIIIFVAEGKYAKLPSPTVAHPPLGIIVMILVLANPIMALFRPDPDSKQRPLFNVAHFLVGLTAHLTAAATLFLGMYMSILNDYQWCKWVMGAFICFHVLTEIVLAVHMNVSKCGCSSSDKNQNTSSQMSATDYQQVRQSLNGSPPVTKEAENSGCLFKTVVLAVYLIVALGCCVAISIQLGTAKESLT